MISSKVQLYSQILIRNWQRYAFIAIFAVCLVRTLKQVNINTNNNIKTIKLFTLFGYDKNKIYISVHSERLVHSKHVRVVAYMYYILISFGYV